MNIRLIVCVFIVMTIVHQVHKVQNYFENFLMLFRLAEAERIDIITHLLFLTLKVP